MLIAAWHMVILCFLLFHVVSPLSLNINPSPRLLSHLNPVNSTAPATSNATITPQTSLSALPIVPHRFRVPTTKTVLHLGFGLLRHHVDPIELKTLMLLTKGIIQADFDRYGGNTIYPLNQHGRQEFLQLGWHIEIRITNLPHGWLFTYRELYEVVEGLRLFLVEGKRGWEIWFEAFSGLGRMPEFGGRAFARGSVRNLGDSEGAEKE